MGIDDFILTHPHIKWDPIEKELGIPIGTIRPGKRKIPKDYVEKLSAYLKDYGFKYKGDAVNDTVSDAVKMYVIKNGSVGKYEGKLFKRIKLPDKTKLIKI